MSRHQVRCETPYPMIGAHFVPVDELGLLPSHKHKENNHHYAFSARSMGRLLVTQTFRDLDRNQVITPIDTHSELHNTYGQPLLPSIREILDVIDEAYQEGESLRYGTAHSPIYRPITTELMTQLGQEYGALL